MSFRVTKFPTLRESELILRKREGKKWITLKKRSIKKKQFCQWSISCFEIIRIMFVFFQNDWKKINQERRNLDRVWVCDLNENCETCKFCFFLCKENGINFDLASMFLWDMRLEIVFFFFVLFFFCGYVEIWFCGFFKGNKIFDKDKFSKRQL